MHDPNAVRIVQEKLEKPPGKEVHLGNITVENGLAGVCRHRSLLFQVLASEIGIETSLVRGYAAFGKNGIPGTHAWNEIKVGRKLYLVDIANPPGGSNFGNFNYEDFMRQGGFPEIGINRFNRKYFDSEGKELYQV